MFWGFGVFLGVGGFLGFGLGWVGALPLPALFALLERPPLGASSLPFACPGGTVFSLGLLDFVGGSAPFELFFTCPGGVGLALVFFAGSGGVAPFDFRCPCSGVAPVSGECGRPCASARRR